MSIGFYEIITYSLIIVPESLRASGTARVELSSHELKLFPRALIRAREQLVRADSPTGRSSTRAL